MNKIACCIFTYNHPAVIKKLFDLGIAEYISRGVDLYIIDSSESNDTQLVIEDLQTSIQSGLYYIRLESNIKADEKMLSLLKGELLTQEYQYIWPCKDRSIFSEETLKNILLASSHNDEFILLDLSMNYENKNTRIYENGPDLLVDCGSVLTSWGVLFIHSDKVLKKLDWDRLDQEYGVSKINSFNQVMITMFVLDEIENAKTRVIPSFYCDGKEITGVKSSWYKKVIETWGQNWPNAIKHLPKQYDSCKKQVIKNMTDSNLFFGTIDRLQFWMDYGNLTKDTFGWIQDNWDELSSVPLECVSLLFENRRDDIASYLLQLIDDCLLSNKYEGIEKYCFMDSQIKVQIGDEKFDILSKAMAIYCMEKKNAKKNHFLHNTKNYLEIMDKYAFLTDFMRKLENDSTIDDSMKSKFINYHITTECLSQIICNECIDHENVIDHFERIFNIY